MDEARKILLTKGKTAIVDADDYDLVMSVPLPWRATWAKGQWYAVTRINGRDKSMQNLLMTAPPDRVIDHKDRDGLNNRRSNLRIATRSQNIHNRRLQSNNKSGFRGVHWRNKEQKWRVEIGYQGKRICLGLFSQLEDAVRAYDEKAKELLGEFAQLNFPESRDAGR